MTCSVAMDVSMTLLCTATASLGVVKIRVEGYICGPEVSAKWDGRGDEAITTKERESLPV